MNQNSSSLSFRSSDHDAGQEKPQPWGPTRWLNTLGGITNAAITTLLSQTSTIKIKRRRFDPTNTGVTKE